MFQLSGFYCDEGPQGATSHKGYAPNCMGRRFLQRKTSAVPGAK